MIQSKAAIRRAKDYTGSREEKERKRKNGCLQVAEHYKMHKAFEYIFYTLRFGPPFASGADDVNLLFHNIPKVLN